MTLDQLRRLRTDRRRRRICLQYQRFLMSLASGARHRPYEIAGAIGSPWWSPLSAARQHEHFLLGNPATLRGH
jgi:hypothetical protein